MPYETIEKRIAPKLVGVITHRGENIPLLEAYIEDDVEFPFEGRLAIPAAAFNADDFIILRTNPTDYIYYSTVDDTVVFDLSPLRHAFPLAFEQGERKDAVERCLDADVFQEVYKLRLVGDKHLEMYGEGVDGFITTNTCWDCECTTEYIHSICLQECSICGCRQEDSPDSRLTELLQEKGFDV